MLSTTNFAPASWASTASAAMSAIPSNGLVGVSHHTSLVVGRIAAATASRSDSGTDEYESPHGTPILSISRNVPP